MSLRLPGELSQILRAEAKKEVASLNALVTSILTRYAYFDRYTKHAGVVVLPTPIFTGLLEVASEAELRQLAEDLGPRIVKPTFAFFHLNPDLATLLSHFMQPMGLHSGWFEFSHRSENSEQIFTLRHEHGTKWSSFLRRFMATMLRSVLGVEPRVEAEEKFVRISLR